MRNNNKRNHIWTKIHISVENINNKINNCKQITIFISIPYIQYSNIHNTFEKNRDAAGLVVKSELMALEQSHSIYSDMTAR